MSEVDKPGELKPIPSQPTRKQGLQTHNRKCQILPTAWQNLEEGYFKGFQIRAQPNHYLETLSKDPSQLSPHL